MCGPHWFDGPTGEHSSGDLPSVTLVARCESVDRLRRRTVHPVEITGRVISVSLAGAVIEAPRVTGLIEGAIARLSCGRFSSAVAVRRRQPTDERELLRYGVQFSGRDTLLRDHLHRSLCVPSAAGVAEPVGGAPSDARPSGR